VAHQVLPPVPEWRHLPQPGHRPPGSDPGQGGRRGRQPPDHGPAPQGVGLLQLQPGVGRPGGPEEGEVGGNPQSLHHQGGGGGREPRPTLPSSAWPGPPSQYQDPLPSRSLGPSDPPGPLTSSAGRRPLRAPPARPGGRRSSARGSSAGAPAPLAPADTLGPSARHERYLS
jgi:hypothetical protein